MVRARVAHPFEPVFDAGSRVLLLGTMPSPRSRENGFYYGHPQNRFWPVLADVLGEPFPRDPDARRALVLRRGIALWDVLQCCDISGASDSSIRRAVPNDLRRITEGCCLRAIFTLGGEADRFYRRFQAAQTGMTAHRLPSPSPANCACSLAALKEAYREILAFL